MEVGIKGNRDGSRGFSCEYHGRAEIEAERGDAALAPLFFIVFPTLADEGFAARELVGDGNRPLTSALPISRFCVKQMV